MFENANPAFRQAAIGDGILGFVLVLILSEQRSGSTQLAETLARAQHCAVLLAEPLLARPGAGGYERFPWASDLSVLFAAQRASQPLKWLREVRAHACSHRRSACAGTSCVAVVKVLRHHDVSDDGLDELLRARDVGSVVLERSAAQTACSLRWSQMSADWAITPSERARAGRAAAHAMWARSCPLVADQEYEDEHRAWFGVIRRTLRDEGRAWVDMTFAEATATNAAIARVARVLVLGAFNTTAPPPLPPVSPPTLSVSTIVTHQSDRFQRWLKHHLDVGIAEVFVFWLNGTPERTDHKQVQHFDLEIALSTGKHRSWWLSWKSCFPCCHLNMGLVRPSGMDGMCRRRLYMPEQAMAFRYTIAHAKSEWILAIDIDERLVGDWQTYLRGLDARSPQPGGAKVLQLQLIGNDQSLSPRPNSFNEKKTIVRRSSVHADFRAFGSIHEPTLARGQFYVDAPVHVLALGHDRYHNFSARARPPAIPTSLRCAVGDAGCESAVVLWRTIREREILRWSRELKGRSRVPLIDGLPLLESLRHQ